MAKNYRCPGCNATLEFLPGEGKMHCSYCGKSYTTKEIEALEKGTGEVKESKPVKMKPGTMQVQIARCSSCGAELAVNDVEVSSFCAYCGQATVVLDRVDEYLKPDYIIPFKVTKEEAEETIRSRIASGFYVPDEIKNFEVEKLRGIYVPFWLYDILYGDEQFWRYTVKRGKYTSTRYSHRVADCHYFKLTADASKKLNDASSQRLEPYDMEELEYFQPMYLSGFYADRYDMKKEETEGVAVARAKEMFNESMKETVRRSATMVSSSPVYEVTGAEYGLLPAWFLTFRQGDVPYTILVNGQTKKMVGAVPCVKWKAALTFIILALISCTLLVPLCGFLLCFAMDFCRGAENLWQIVLGIVLGGFALFTFVWGSAIKKVIGYMESMKLTRSGVTSQFVGERQEK